MQWRFKLEAGSHVVVLAYAVAFVHAIRQSVKRAALRTNASFFSMLGYSHRLM